MATQTVSTDQAVQPNTSSAQPGAPPDRSAILEDVIRHFAAVCGCSPEDTQREIVQLGGDMVATDKEAKAIFAYLEAQYQRDDLFNPVDLCSPPTNGGNVPSGKPSGGQGGCVDPAQDTSVCALVDIIAGKLGL